MKGLSTPGYYIFALHVRRVPIGFEPLAPEVNTPEIRNPREKHLKDVFWVSAIKGAKKSAAIAKCRKQKLLIYFASDDLSLRAVATKMLQAYGEKYLKPI